MNGSVGRWIDGEIDGVWEKATGTVIRGGADHAVYETIKKNVVNK